MNLVLEIEYLGGVAYAAVSPDSDAPDWPPQPDRVFSALVASWAARGQREDEAVALRWLEGLPPPSIVASAARPRTSPQRFVPANDASSGKQKHALNVMPQLRNRQARRFPAAWPDDPVVRLIWSPADAQDGTLAALQALAADTSYVGHSASLTRCRFLSPETVPAADVQSPSRSVYAGRLSELQAALARGHRPSAGVWVDARETTLSDVPGTVFDTRWLILEPDEGSQVPDVRAAALVARAIRDRLVAGYERAGLVAPEVVSGRTAEGAPARAPHLAVAALPFAGFPHADGHILGFALIPPKGSDLFQSDPFMWAMRDVAPMRPSDGRRVMGVHLPGSGDVITLCPTFEPSRTTLEPGLYARLRGRPARVFATVTPIVLDRHPKGPGSMHQAEVARIIADACRHIGLPRPAEIQTDVGPQPAVIADRHSAMEGVPAAQPPGASPPWMSWRLPPSLAGRLLTHAVVRFEEPVEGPVILGAGRYVGLGLCRPLRDPSEG